MRTLKLGTRGSKLALTQSRFVRDQLEDKTGLAVEIEVIKTTGDRITDRSFDQMEGEGFFTKEIEEALLTRRIDLAVHSLKDLRTTMPDGLTVGAVGFREDRREFLIMRPGLRQESGVLPLPAGAVIGTSSARRQSQIAFYNPDLRIKDLRGNVPTRVEKVRQGDYDAIIVAAAGVTRLNLDLSDLEAVWLAPQLFLPAPGQGILAIQNRSSDAEIEEVIATLDSESARIEVALERGLLALFDAGCSLPLGVYSEVESDRFHLAAVLGKRDGSSWKGLDKAEADGKSVDEVVNAVYADLTSNDYKANQD
ncbi:MAG: hydroxymethylbilane synthase [candidate division Zixibacteria bacterium]|nr:hydroxymethylbilane synthase [candidate division Zixibacteria bacterium]